MLKFINHLGEEIEFGKGNILINESNVKDYKYNYNIVNDSVEGFEYESPNPSFEVFIYGKDRKDIANRLFEIIEVDVLAEKSGILIDGDYSLEGFFVASQKKKYENRTIINLNLEFISAKKWFKKTKKTFDGEQLDVGGLDYSYDYDYDFTLDSSPHEITNPNFYDSDFELRISGPAVSPSIEIGGHLYNVDIEVNEGCILVINSQTKKIYIINSDGTEINVFYARNRDNYIFEKIKSGKQSIVYDEDMKFELTFIDERSEPEWI